MQRFWVANKQKIEHWSFIIQRLFVSLFITWSVNAYKAINNCHYKISVLNLLQLLSWICPNLPTIARPRVVIVTHSIVFSHHEQLSNKKSLILYSNNILFIDVNECSGDVCGENTDCENTMGSYICTCKSGYARRNMTSCLGKGSVNYCFH